MSASNIVRITDYASASAKQWPTEAFFISALIEEGQYHPGKYGIGPQHFSAFKDVHAFCLDHQAKAGRAPTLDLIQRKYPRFPFVERIDPVWAAHDLVDAWANRTLRSAMGKATEALVDEDVPAAISALRSALTIATPALTKGTGVSDFTDIEAALGMPKVPIGPADSTIMKYTGGIGPGELWYVAARLGIGKTWDLITKSVAAAEAGWNVVFFSTEMPSKSVKERIQMVAMRQHIAGWGALPVAEKRRLMEAWQETAGRITIYDPSSGPCDATRVAAAAHDDTLVVIDYLGLMRATSGERAISDWRAAATISNELKEATLEYKIPIICAAQINREGQKSAKMGPEHLSQSDALGQDGDVIITLKDFSTRVRLNALVKNRHGVGGIRWYSRFEPAAAAFEDISAEKAHHLSSSDEEAAAAALE